MTELENEIARHIGDQILPGTPQDKILASSSLFDDGIVDSLGLQQLIVYLEDNHDIEVEEDHLVPDNFETVAGIAQLVKKLGE